MRSLTLTFLCALLIAAPANAADWPSFRGPARDGRTPDDSAPTNWTKTQNIKWKAKLPVGGNSSPIVSGDRVFISCAQDGQGLKRSLYCFSRANGNQLWVRTVNYDIKEPTHGTNPYCASTPAADGQRIVVWHGSAGVYCYDYEGKELWKADLGTFRHIWGYASSPVFLGNSVILNCGPGGRSFVIALDRNSGKPLWKTEEPVGADDKLPSTQTWAGAWNTPVIATIAGQKQILIAQPRAAKAYDPATGQILWFCSGLGDLAYCDILFNDTHAVAMSGYGGPAIGFKLGGQGDVTKTNQLWRVQGNPQRISSGIVVGSHIIMANEPEISCIEMETGKVAWRHKPPGNHTFWAPMSATPTRLYVTSQSGTTFVFAPDVNEFKLLAKNEIGERCNSAIAIADGQLILRTWESLYCIERKN